MNTIIKVDKKQNFLRFLHKKNKSLVLFCQSESAQDFMEFKKNMLLIKKEKLEQYLKVFENFDLIRKKIAQTYNPFKDPQYAFKQIQKN